MRATRNKQRKQAQLPVNQWGDSAIDHQSQQDIHHTRTRLAKEDHPGNPPQGVQRDREQKVNQSKSHPKTPQASMSHFTTIKTQIKDIHALTAACKELGLRLTPNSTARGFIGRQHRGDFVIHLNGPYDIALNLQPDRTYGFTADLWRGVVEEEVGQNYGKLLQLYGVHKSMIEARKRGHLVQRTQRQDGTIKLMIAAS